MALAYGQKWQDDKIEFVIGIDFCLSELKIDYPKLTRDELVAILDEFSIHAAMLTGIKNILDRK